MPKSAEKFGRSDDFRYLCPQKQETKMTALQLRAELGTAINTIADDETLMTKALKYIKRLAAKKADPTLMTKEEFVAKIRTAEEQVRQGKVHRMRPDETLDEFMDRMRADGVLH